jgi:glycosyltransferase involved in cell wall biosynthesis
LIDEFLWLAAGRLEPVKDYPTLLRAFAAIQKPARLLIAGTGALEASLHQLVSELEIEERVHLIGFSGDVRRWMQAADGFVLSSLWEGLPMSLLEAAACALPAVATDVAGTREIVVQDQTGFLAAPGDVEGLAGAMARLMEMPNQVRDAMGNYARKMAIERYSLDRVLDRWEALYGELLRERHAVTLARHLVGE